MKSLSKMVNDIALKDLAWNLIVSFKRWKNNEINSGKKNVFGI